MTGTRFAAASITTSMTRMCSSWVKVGDSPVVPTGTSPSTPAAICSSTRRRSASSSRRSRRNGVTSAVMTPSNIAHSYITPPAIHGWATGNIVDTMQTLISGLLVLVLGLCAASQGACGTGAAKAGDASTSDGLVTIDGRVLPDTGPAIDAAHPGDFIAADV